MERLEQLSDTFKQVTEDELKMGHLLDSRVKYLQQVRFSTTYLFFRQ